MMIIFNRNYTSKKGVWSADGAKEAVPYAWDGHLTVAASASACLITVLITVEISLSKNSRTTRSFQSATLNRISLQLPLTRNTKYLVAIMNPKSSSAPYFRLSASMPQFSLLLSNTLSA